MKTDWSSVGISRLVLAICSLLLDTPFSDALCPSLYSENGGSCYRIAAETIDWVSAESKCVADGGHLASVSSQAENDYVFGLRGAYTEFWIGLNDKINEGTYVWTDGTAFSFENWKRGQPKPSNQDKEDCVSVKRQNDDSGKWEDKQCTGPKTYVCERDVLIPPTSPPARTTPSSSNSSTTLSSNPMTTTTISVASTSEQVTTTPTSSTTSASIPVTTTAAVTASQPVRSTPSNTNAGTTLASLPVTNTGRVTSMKQTGTMKVTRSPTSHLPISTTQPAAVTDTNIAATTAVPTLTTSSVTQFLASTTTTTTPAMSTTSRTSTRVISTKRASERPTTIPAVRVATSPSAASSRLPRGFTSSPPVSSSPMTDNVQDKLTTTTNTTDVGSIRSAASSNIVPVAASASAVGILLVVLLLLLFFWYGRYYSARRHKRDAKKTLPFTDNNYEIAMELMNEPMIEEDLDYETVTELLSLPDTSRASSIAPTKPDPVLSSSSEDDDLHFFMDGDQYLDPATIFPTNPADSGLAPEINSRMQAELKTKLEADQEQGEDEDDNDEEDEEKHYSLIFSKSNDADFWQPATAEEEIYAQLKSDQFRHIDPSAVTTTVRLGSGEFGTVDKGTWQLSETKKKNVAVKTLHAGSADARVRFLREAAIMGQFRHKNVVRMYGVVTATTPMRIVLEYMGNGDLKNHLISLRPWSSGEWCPAGTSARLLQVTKGVANGMAYLASKSFVHRDLAARNVLVSHRGVCKIGDFGLARDLADDSYYISHGGKLPIRWTAPEAINYLKYTVASDVWSYGILLFEIWSLGERPFGFTSNAEVISKTERGYRLPPTPGCPRLVYGLMIDCWNPDYHQRPTFSDIVNRLSVSEKELLAISQHDRQLVGRLGDTLESSSDAFRDMQERYL